MRQEVRQFFRRRMTEEYRAELARAFEKWRGAVANVEGYQPVRGQLTVRLWRAGVLGHLSVTTENCTYFRGPTRWENAALALERISEGEDAGAFRLVDARAGFSATCDQVFVHDDSDDPSLTERPEFKAFLADLDGARFLRLDAGASDTNTERVYEQIRGIFEHARSELREVEPRQEPGRFRGWLSEQTKDLDFTEPVRVWSSSLAWQVATSAWIELELAKGLESLLPLWTKQSSSVVLVFLPVNGVVFAVFKDEDRWSYFRQPW